MYNYATIMELTRTSGTKEFIIPITGNELQALVFGIQVVSVSGGIGPLNPIICRVYNTWNGQNSWELAEYSWDVISDTGDFTGKPTTTTRLSPIIKLVVTVPPSEYADLEIVRTDLDSDDSFNYTVPSEVDSLVRFMKNGSVTAVSEDLIESAPLPVKVLNFPGESSGDTVKTSLVRQYGSHPVTTSWVELIASTSHDYKRLSAFDSSGELMEFGVGSVGTEVSVGLIQPGGSDLSVSITSGSRLVYRAVTTSATVGYLALNCY